MFALFPPALQVLQVPLRLQPLETAPLKDLELTRPPSFIRKARITCSSFRSNRAGSFSQPTNLAAPVVRVKQEAVQVACGHFRGELANSSNSALAAALPCCAALPNRSNALLTLVSTPSP